MRKWLIAFLLLACTSTGPLIVAGGIANAGDSVDYSAPYMTVENGELITKYPAKEHTPGTAATPPPSTEVTGLPKKDTNLPLLWSLTLAAIAVAGLVFRLRSGDRKRQVQKTDSVK